jgi:hypothetical protein
MKRTILLLLLLVLPAFAASPGVEVKTEVDKAKVEVGQTLRLTIDLLVAPDADLAAVPAEKITFAPFEVRDAARTTLPSEGDRRKVRYTFKLAAYEEGKLKIPPASFPYKRGDASQVATSQEVSVDVGRVPSAKADKQGEIRDLKAAVASPVPTVLYVAGAIALLLGLLLLRSLVNHLRRKKSQVMVAEPPLPPFEHALRELARLERERLPEQDRHEEYYDRLTGTLRYYLSWRYGVPMLERTSSEILADVRRQEILPAEQFAELKRILEEGDLVKFARFGPPAATCDTRLGTARGILEFARPSEPKPARELVGAGGPR